MTSLKTFIGSIIAEASFLFIDDESMWDKTADLPLKRNTIGRMNI